MSRAVSLSAPLRVRDYRRLWSAQAVSVVGDKLNQIALAVLVYEITGSMLQMGIMLAASAVPAALFSMIAGAYVDRWDKRRTMVVADIARALLVLLVPWAASVHVTVVYVIAFAVATVSLFFEPARLSLLPDVLPEGELLAANSLDNASSATSELLGLALGGVAVAALGFRSAFLADAATYLVSALLVFSVSYRQAPRLFDPNALRPGMRADIAEGLAHVWHSPVLRDVIAIQTLASFAGFGLITLINLLALDTFEGGSIGLAALDGAITAGLLVGSVLVGRSGPGHPGAKFLSGLLAFGALCMLLALAPAVLPALGILLFSGMANMWFQVPMITMMQTRSAASLRGRVMAARTAVTRVAGAIGLIGAGFLAEQTGVRGSIAMLGGVVVLAALLGLARPALRNA